MEYLAQRLFSSICVLKRGYIAFHVGRLKPLPLVLRREILKRGLEQYATPLLHLFHVNHLSHLVEKKTLRKHRCAGQPRLFLLPIKAEKRKPFPTPGHATVEQNGKGGRMAGEEWSLHRLSSLRRGRPSGKRTSLDQYVNTLQGRRAPRGLAGSFCEQSKATQRGGKKMWTPIHPAMDPVGSGSLFADRTTETPFRKGAVRSIGKPLLVSSCKIEMPQCGSDPRVKRWKDRLGMPTHRFFPTMGSLLLLEESSPLERDIPGGPTAGGRRMPLSHWKG